jgi:ATP phosphoribosyltransferase regulatory subunit
MEYYETVGVASSTSDQKLFKLLNNRGTTMVLRSDMTTPISRVVSSLLKEEPLPLRLSYHANVFRSIEEEAGKEAEFFQTGVELVGDNSAEADAEVVALAVASLQAAGVSSFKIALGHVGFLNGLLEEAIPGREDVQQELKDRLLRRDFAGYRETLAMLDLSIKQREELADILKLRGGKEICRQALKLSDNSLVQSSIEHLIAVWEALEDFDVAKHIMIDLTMIGDFSYYTGMIFEGYAADIGFPVCSGGRYDKLLQQFGRPAPATGFSLKTNRILDGVDGVRLQRELPVLMQYDAPNRKKAFIEAERLRSEGRSVIMRLMSVPDELWTGALPGTMQTVSQETSAPENAQGIQKSIGPLGPLYSEVVTFVSAELLKEACRHE